MKRLLAFIFLIAIAGCTILNSSKKASIPDDGVK